MRDCLTNSLPLIGVICIYLLVLIIPILYTIARWKLFEKAGKGGWRSLIPVLNTWDIIDLAWSSSAATWTIIFIFLSIVFYKPIFEISNTLSGALFESNYDPNVRIVSPLGIIPYLFVVFFVIWLPYTENLGKAFGKKGMYNCGLLFFYPFFIIHLGLSKTEYQGNHK